MPKIERPYFPIIYVRGYAGTDPEIEDTVAEPYMGFALGATKFRQVWDGSVRRHYFESPLFRLVKDFGYGDVYQGGQEMPLDLEVGPRSVFIYRYYDEQYFDDLMGQGGQTATVSGQRRPIENFAEGLSRLVLRVRDRICGDDPEARNAFRVYLVAHSMGGLVCRCFLQNSEVGTDEAKALVDKVFTYATPHNGIELSVIGNVPSFFTMNNADNFNRNRMAEYLGFEKTPDDVSSLNGKFDPDRLFCLVGTNWRDYEVGVGAVRRVVGPMSDGLVRIGNATTSGSWQGGAEKNSPRAFVNRSHSGHYGIVNSEEGYQNLVRFLFGDVRVDGFLDVHELTLPKEVQAEKDAGNDIKASYHFETIVRVRGYDWELHRRIVDDESAIFRTYDEMFGKDGTPRNPYLFSTFLSIGGKVQSRRPSLGFAVDIRVLVPDYEIKGLLWRSLHYKGSYLFRDTITIEATPKTDEGGREFYQVRYGFDSSTPNRATRLAAMTSTGEYRIPLESKTRPGIKADFVLRAKEWE